MITVVNTHRTKEGEYIGRGSPLGNPYTHRGGTKALYVVSTRDDAIEAYRRYIRAEIQNGTPEVIAEFYRLYLLASKGDLKLRCYCSPARCHGDVIKEILDGVLSSQ